MQTHQLKRPKGNQSKRPRVGRGGKRGTTAGKGTKGQKARAGHRIRPAIRDLIQRLPKRRGYGKNRARTVNSEKIKLRAISLSALEKLSVEKITNEVLRKEGLLKRKESAKILNTGEITKKISVENVAISAKAKEKIEKAGGSVTLPKTKKSEAKAE